MLQHSSIMQMRLRQKKKYYTFSIKIFHGKKYKNRVLKFKKSFAPEALAIKNVARAKSAHCAQERGNVIYFTPDYFFPFRSGLLLFLHFTQASRSFRSRDVFLLCVVRSYIFMRAHLHTAIVIHAATYKMHPADGKLRSAICI
jgi:hypothetical protein